MFNPAMRPPNPMEARTAVAYGGVSEGDENFTRAEDTLLLSGLKR
jgi:hypothetical protein